MVYMVGKTPRRATDSDGDAKTPRLVSLGVEVRDARTAAGITQQRLADLADVSNAMISRLESGKQMPRIDHINSILTVLGVPSYRRDELLNLARHSGDPQWVEVGERERKRQRDALKRYEDEAFRIVSVSPLLIPGLAQCAAYTKAMLLDANVPADAVESRVDFRSQRAAVLDRDTAPNVLFVIGEAVLHQNIGGPKVMREQLRSLQRIAKRPRVELRVLPTRGGWNPALEGPFTLLDTNTETVVHIEGRLAGMFLHQPAEVAAYREAVDMVLNAAMTPTESQGAIAKAITGTKETETAA